MLAAAALTPADLLTKASADPGPILFIAGTTALYLWGVVRLARAGQDWAPARTASFCLAELVLAVATISGLGSVDATNFTVQAIQYSMVGMVAPVLFALSAPVTLALAAGGPRVRAVLAGMIRGGPGRALTRPLVTWVLYAGPLFALYFTGLSAAGVRNSGVDQIIYLGLLATGCAFCWAVVGVDPLPRRYGFGLRIAYIILSFPLYSILGMALESQDRSVSPHIAVGDLHTGGGIVWVIGDAIALLGAIAVFVQWLRADERDAQRIDEASEQAAAEQLAHWRAARDAAAKAIST
jgi:putative copper resistance protein D